MSFLNIRGENIHCKVCDANIKIEYEGGMQFTQIGDINVEIQKKLNEHFMPCNYDYDEDGYYFHSFGICKDCIEKEYKSSDEYVLLENDHIIFRYEEEIDRIKSEIEFWAFNAFKDYFKDITVDRLKDINYKEFSRISNTKTFGIKKEKRYLSQSFVKKSENSILENYRQYILNSEKYKKLYEEGKKFNRENTQKVLEWKDTKAHVYRQIDYEGLYNLNDYICAPTTVRKGTGSTQDIEFYDDPLEINAEKLNNLLEDEAKFTLENPEAIESLELRKDKILKKMIFIISKMDFWS